MTSTIRLNYEATVADYWNRLTNVLRGFTASDDLRFLDTWVPHEEPSENILGILEAAAEGKVCCLELELSHETASRLKLNELEAKVKPFGRLEVERKSDRVVLTTRFGGPLLDVHPTYRTKLQRFVGRTIHEGQLGPGGGITVSAKSNGVVLSARLDPSNHRILEARHSGCQSETHRALMEALCEQIEGLPIQECSDHAGIRLEHRLRDPQVPRPSQGIVLAETVDAAFRIVVELTRCLLERYREEANYNETANTYVPRPSQEWLGLSNVEKCNRVSAFLSEELKMSGVSALRIDGDRIVVLQFAVSEDGKLRGDLIRRIERELKERLELTLQVHLEPKIDQNKIRQAKGIKL
jgi:hypothetical protein